jgi:glycosyltransferase involved in cell wall biosynthesis
VKKKIIVIDATGANTFGAKYNIKSLLIYFIKNYKNHKLIIYSSEPFLSEYDTNDIYIKNISALKNLYLRLVWTTILLPVFSFFNKAEVVYSPFDIGPFFSLGNKIVLGIKNPNYVLPQNLVTLRYPKIHKVVSYISSFSAKKYLYPSNYAFNYVGKFYPKNNLKGGFVHHGIDLSDWTIKYDFLSSHKYIFFCSVLYKFKNIEVLFKALKIINEKIEGKKLHLIICGKFVSEQYRKEINNLIDSLGIRSELKMFESLPRKEIIKYYQNAELNIIPTLYETFGHMYLEALQSGNPVLVGDILIAREILDDSVLYFPCSDYKHLSEIVINRDYTRNHLKRKSRGFEIIKSFSVENECKKTFEFLLKNSK